MIKRFFFEKIFRSAIYLYIKKTDGLMNIKLLKISGIIFFISVFGCSKISSDENNIKYSIKKFERTFTSPYTTLKNYAKIFFEYPVITKAANQQVKDSIAKYVKETFLNNYFGNAKSKSLDEMADSLFKDFKSFQEEFKDSPQSWEIEGTTSVIYNNHSIVSLQTDTYWYLGGVHPNELSLLVSLNSENGKRINFSDLFKNEYKAELTKIAEKIFRKEKGLNQDENLEEAGFWFEENKFSLNENFEIKNEGLFFYFNSYEIAPYSMGPTEILIPYDEIKNLIKEDGLLFEVAAIKN